MEKELNISVTENGGKAIEIMAGEIIKAKRTQTFWGRVKIGAVVIIMGMIMITTAHDQYSEGGKDSVAVVNISGVIGEGAGSADAIIPALQKAFDKKGAVAVVLSIDSPGGSPTDADRIAQSLEEMKKDSKKPVVAVIEGVGASAAYMIAAHADKIVASKYSLVGSIGVIVQSWDYHELMEKVGVRQRVFASGKLKAMLNPYSQMTPDAEVKAQEIVDRMAKRFVEEVKSTRGGKMKDRDWFTGEVWPGDEAVEWGLVDELGTLETYVKKNFNDPVVVVVKPRVGKNFLGMSDAELLFIDKAYGLVSGIFK